MERVLLQMMDQEDIAALESFARGVLPSLAVDSSCSVPS